MRTLGILVTLAVGILSAPLSSAAEQPGKVYRIGVLMPGFAPVRSSPLLELFRQGLRELGYVEGQNIILDWRWAEGRYDRLPDLAAELVRLKVDVLVTNGTPAIRAAKQVTTTTPIVMAFSDDPVGTGLVASLARPGGNITGLSFLSSELSGKRLELLKEAVPRVSRVAILWNSANPSAALQVRETEVAARSLGLKLQRLAVQDPNGFDRAFSAMARGRAGVLVVVDDPMFVDYYRQIADLAARSRLPAMYGLGEFVDAGGLMSYGPNVADTFRRSAFFVSKILRGAKPGEIPVEQPMRFELVINLKTAKALGLTIPNQLLFQADQILR